MTRIPVTFRLSAESHAYLQAEAERSGLSANMVLEAFMAEAAAQRWQVAGPHFVVLAGHENHRAAGGAMTAHLSPGPCWCDGRA